MKLVIENIDEQLKKTVIRVDNSAQIILPNEWIGKEVYIIPVKKEG